MKTSPRKAGLALLALFASATLASVLYAKDRDVVVDVEIVTPVILGQSSDLLDSDSGACKTGCSLAKHDIPDFTVEQFRQALSDYQLAAIEAPEKALETLLFYGARTRALLEEEGSQPLSPDHLEFLNKELSRDHAFVEIRVVGEDEQVLVATAVTRVPLGKKQHLRVMSEKYLPLEFNGTVMRVGRDYLWSRF